MILLQHPIAIRILKQVKAYIIKGVNNEIKTKFDN